MEKGIVKWFSDQKGYGFIQREHGEDVFVHFSEIDSSGFKTLHESDEVEFKTENSEKGLVAKCVKIVKSGKNQKSA